MKKLVLGLIALLALWGVVEFAASFRAEPAVIAVAFKLTDPKYQPLSGVPVRVTFAGQDWQSQDAGQRFVTDAAGEAHFIANAAIDHRIRSVNIGFLASMPASMEHLLIATELERVVPLGGKDTSFHWLLVTNVYCDKGEENCEGGDVNEIYARDDTGRFGRELEPRTDVLPMAKRADPDSQAVAYGAGYEPSDWELTGDEDDPTHTHWHLKLAFKKLPKPVP